MPTTNPPEFDFDSMDYHPGLERLTKYLSVGANSSDLHFIRLVAIHYLGIVTSTMRNSVLLPGARPVPLNTYVVGLLPSGCGKGVLTGMMENVISPLSDTFYTTWVDKRTSLIGLEAQRLSTKYATDPKDELKKVTKSWESLGVPLLTFSEGTSPAFKQARSALVNVPYGSMNYIVDECLGVGAQSSELWQGLIINYDVGEDKQKLIKHTTDTPRHIDAPNSRVPTNMLMFGTGSYLDNPAYHQEMYDTCQSGLGRRALFAFSRDNLKPPIDAQTRLKDLKATADPTLITGFKQSIQDMISPNMAGKMVYMDDATDLYLLEYQVFCENRARTIKDPVLRAEVTHRYMKATKVAAILACFEGTSQMTIELLQAAFKIVEDGHDHVVRLITTKPAHARLAEFLADYEGELTMSQLMTKLPWVKGTAAAKEEMIQLASEYGYSNCIAVNQEVRRNITFYSGTGIEETNLKSMIASVSNHQAYNYQPGVVPFEEIAKLVSTQGQHWCTHHFTARHRTLENTINGFNMIVLDIDNSSVNATGVSMVAAQHMFRDYKYIMHETKSSTPQCNRYRIILPISHVLYLNEVMYRRFMDNVFAWLPMQLDVDPATNQRNRKWLTNGTPAVINDGKMIPVMDFMPDTERAATVAKRTVALGSLSRVEKWVARRIENDKLPRNNELTKYAFMLVDAGIPQEDCEKAVELLNKKLSLPLPAEELQQTIYQSIARKLAEPKKDNT